MKLMTTSRFRMFAAHLMLCIALPLPLQAADAPSEKLPKGAVAAQGGVVVMMQDIDAAAQKIPEKDRAGYFDSPKRIESTITNLLVTKQLAVQARSAKLDKDPAVKSRMDAAAEDALANAQIEHFQKSLKVPDFDELAQEYYTAHKDEFVAVGGVTVQHILVATKSKDRSEADAKLRIAEVEKIARAHPDQFEALIQKYSDDPSKDKNGGTIEDAASSKMVRPFAEASSALKTPGDISPVVKTGFGFHLIKLVSHTPDRQKSFDEVHRELVAKLKSNFMEQQFNEYTGALRGKPLVADPDLVASLRTRYAPPGYKSPEDVQQEADAQRKKAQATSTEPQH